METELEKQIRNAPQKTGIYLFKDRKEKILYVGKAVNLRSRLQNYLNPKDKKTKKLVAAAEKIETVLTETQEEALVLEDALVKQNQPRYNVRLRDDKKYPYIKFTVQEKYPWVEITRKVELDGSRYFGPYTDATAVRKILNTLSKIFGIRRCTYDLEKRKRPCLKHEVGKCAAPRLVTGEKEYRKLVQQALSFLEGNYSQVKNELLEEIERYSEKRNFEKAASLKESLDSIKSIAAKQDLSDVKLEDMDVLGYARHKKKANITQMKIRNHKVVAVLQHPLRGEYVADEKKAMKAFIKQHYVSKDVTPELLIVSSEPEDRKLLEKHLRKMKNKKVEIRKSMRGRKRKLSEMAVENSLHQLKQEELKKKQDPVKILQKALGMDKRPERIEGYDISNLGDKQVVGSMVVFTEGKKDKKEYRRFKIQNEKQDDVHNLKEILERRFNHEEWEFPDLVLLDGGRGQLNAGLSVIPRDIYVIALAKKNEEIYVPEREKPYRPPERHPGLQLLQQVRDEAHRFAKKYHRKRREMEFIEEE